MNVFKLSELRNKIVNMVKETETDDFPKIITFTRGIGHPKYRITVEETEDDFFIDSKGTRWVKQK